MSPALSHCSLRLKQFSFLIRCGSITRTPLSDAVPPPSSACAGPLLAHAVYARLPINAAARPRSGVLPLPGSDGYVDRTIPIFDPTTEGKEPGVTPQSKSKGVDDLGIVTLECKPAAGWIACRMDAYYDLVIDVTF